MRKGLFDQQYSGMHYGPDTTDRPVESVPELIQKRAYEIYEARSKQPGHELDDWLQAEREIKTYSGF
jgi:hypothetical protein